MPEPDGGEPSGFLAVLQGVAQADARVRTLDARVQEMAADLKRVKQVVGMLPANSMAPQARTFQLRTLITVGASVAAGALFDKFVALLAHWAGAPIGN